MENYVPVSNGPESSRPSRGVRVAAWGVLMAVGLVAGLWSHSLAVGLFAFFATSGVLGLTLVTWFVWKVRRRTGRRLRWREAWAVQYEGLPPLVRPLLSLTAELLVGTALIVCAVLRENGAVLPLAIAFIVIALGRLMNRRRWRARLSARRSDQ